MPYWKVFLCSDSTQLNSIVCRGVLDLEHCNKIQSALSAGLRIGIPLKRCKTIPKREYP